MAPSDYRVVRSTTAIFGHPIYPMLAVFPIGFLGGTHWIGGGGGGGASAMAVPIGIILSAVVVGILLITGWLGGKPVFRHRIGMLDESEALWSVAGAPLTGIDFSPAGGPRTPV